MPKDLWPKRAEAICRSDKVGSRLTPFGLWHFRVEMVIQEAGETWSVRYLGWRPSLLLGVYAIWFGGHRYYWVWMLFGLEAIAIIRCVRYLVWRPSLLLGVDAIWFGGHRYYSVWTLFGLEAIAIIRCGRYLVWRPSLLLGVDAVWFGGHRYYCAIFLCKSRALRHIMDIYIYIYC